MNKGFYPKLALRNIRKNSRIYYPYLLTSVLTILMYYIMTALSVSREISEKMVYGVDIQLILQFGCIVIAIFAIIFMFYTNSFLIKQRKKEIGLLNILGMGKMQIARLMLWESFITAGFSIILGIIGGIVFSRLAFMFLARLTGYSALSDFPPQINGIISTAILFAVIFALTLVFNILQIKLAKPVELLNGGNAGEKEPKAKWALGIIGLIFLIIGYYIALSVESSAVAIGVFFVAVLFVIGGTYLLFISGSIIVLKILKANKNYYYKKNHFISVSGMLYRMKKNGSGLANIAILSTMVLVTVSTTISLYSGQNQYIRNVNPRYAYAECHGEDESENQAIFEKIHSKLAEYDLKQTNESKYRYYKLWSEETQYVIIPADDYNEIEGRNVTLAENEAVVFGLYEKYVGSTVSPGNITLDVKESIDSLFGTECLNIDADPVVYVVVKDMSVMSRITGGSAYYVMYGFELEGTAENIQRFDLYAFDDDIGKCTLGTRGNDSKSMLAIYGGLLFIGIFLGGLFLMITVLIIYYKQITEGYEDKSRYEIMEKVGISQREVKKVINSQVKSVFFLPLAVAVVHIAFAFKMITKMLALLGLTQTWLFALCVLGTIAVFSLIYFIVYTLTARAYYKIVRN